MTRADIDATAMRYLDAIERDDFATTTEIWKLAETSPELTAALQEVHRGLVEEMDAAD